jgi:hypothetical protein
MSSSSLPGAVALASPSGQIVAVRPGPPSVSMDSPGPHDNGGTSQHSGPSSASLRNDLSCGELCCPSALAGLLCAFSFPLALCLAPCQQVNVRQELVLLSYGKFVGVLREPGCYCSNPCGRDSRFVSTAVQSTDLPALKVIDKRGNPYELHSASRGGAREGRRTGDGDNGNARRF